jgi:hypothetical protein
MPRKWYGVNIGGTGASGRPQRCANQRSTPAM